MSNKAEHIRRARTLTKSLCVLVKEPGLNANGRGEPVPLSVFHAADPSTGRMDPRGELGTGPQLGSSWMNSLVMRSGESFSAGWGHRRIWGEEEKELLVLYAQGSQEPALQAMSSTAPFWAI